MYMVQTTTTVPVRPRGQMITIRKKIKKKVKMDTFPLRPRPHSRRLCSEGIIMSRDIHRTESPTLAACLWSCDGTRTR
jgi:hypothetical protein